MKSGRLRILGVPDERAWATRASRPRFLFPLERSADPCIRCPGHCCVPEGALTTVEALRVALALKIPVDEVVERRPVSQGGAGGIPLAEGRIRLYMRLSGAGMCTFLHHTPSRGFCSIYSVRPGMCRIYPFEVRLGRRHVRVGSQAYCPVPWLQNADIRARVGAGLRAWARDEALERRLLAAWRARRNADCSWAAYVAFAVRRLERHLGVSADLLLEAPRRRLGPRITDS